MHGEAQDPWGLWFPKEQATRRCPWEILDDRGAYKRCGRPGKRRNQKTCDAPRGSRASALPKRMRAEAFVLVSQDEAWSRWSIRKGDNLSRGHFTNALSACPTRAMGPSQSPKQVCRNKRTVGYQGLSSRSVNQRQSGAEGSTTQVCFPSAPARCATAVSTVMITSRWAINAAVSAKSLIAYRRSVIGALIADSCDAAAPICNEKKCRPSRPRRGSNRDRGIERI